MVFLTSGLVASLLYFLVGAFLPLELRPVDQQIRGTGNKTFASV